jgi:hypothetical protein
MNEAVDNDTNQDHKTLPASPDAPYHDVIQIHGTWGRFFRRTAAWCRPEHLCRRSIEHALGPNTTFHTFGWSGANSPAARLRATARLADCIRDIRRQRNSCIHVVAHSHAGNIALCAARDEEIARQLSSITCLSTPFLHIAPRELGPALALKLELTAALAVISLLFLLCAWIWPTEASEAIRLSRTGSWAFYVFGVLPTGLIAGLLVKVVMRLFQAGHRANHAYARRFELPRSVPCPVLLLRAPADEASAFLGAVQLASAILTRFLRWVAALVPADPPMPAGIGIRQRWRLLRRSVRIGAILIAAGLGVLPILLLMKAAGILPGRTIVGWALDGSLILMLGGALAMLFGTLLQFVAIPIVSVLSVLLGVLAIPFGLRFAFAAIGLHISAEATPAGDWLVTQLDSGSAPLQDLRGLNHQTHSDPRALAVVSAFLAKWFGPARACGNGVNLSL